VRGLTSTVARGVEDGFHSVFCTVTDPMTNVIGLYGYACCCTITVSLGCHYCLHLMPHSRFIMSNYLQETSLGASKDKRPSR
jgi:hypothetical protein